MAVTALDRERGATLVEYALGLALFAVVLLGAIQVLERRSAERLDAEVSQLAVEGPAKTGTPTRPGEPIGGGDPTPDPGGGTNPASDPGEGWRDVEVASSSGQLVWWNGKDGAWEPSVTFDYAWPHGGHLTLRITEHRRNGSTAIRELTVWIGSGTTTTALGQVKLANAASSDVIAVEIEALRIATKDGAGVQGTFPLSGVAAYVSAPPH